MLKEVQALLLRQEYRAAQRLLIPALQGLKNQVGGSRPSPLNCAMMTALGEVLVNSGNYDPARVWLERALKAYDQTADPSRQMLAEQATTAILLSKAYARLDKTEPAIATIETMLARYRRARTVDPVVELELLRQLASFDKSARSPDAVAALKEEVGRLARQLPIDHQRGAVGNEDYARGLAALADCRFHTADWAAAAETTEKIIRLRAARHEILEELSARRRLAEIHRQRPDHRAEIETLRAALETVKRELAGSVAISPDLQVRYRYEQAELQRLSAAALLADGRRDEAIGQLVAAQNDFVAALALARQSTVTSAVSVSEGRLLERIADITGQRVELGLNDAEHLRQTIARHAELLGNYQQTLLADDPRIGSLELILGGLYLKAGDRARAEPLLQEALAYWRGRIPPDVLRLAQTLHLLGESALLAVPAPPAGDIEQYLREAHSLCLAHFPSDPLRWRTQLALGRLSVTTGRYRQALDSLREIATSADPVPNDVSSAALLELGLLHQQLLRFDEADRFCRQGLELRQRVLGDADPELTPFFLALGSLQVARRDAAALDESVLRAAALGVARSSNPAWRWEFAHQQAMAHYLRNELASDRDQRQAARAGWQQLLTQEADLPTALRARTLHYLARLDYLDWSSELDAWNRDFARNNASSSQRLTRLAEELEKYQTEHGKFLADFAAYNPSPTADKTLTDREKQFRELLDRRTALEVKRLELRKAHAAALEEETQRIQAESGVQKAWLAKLAAGRKLAEEAIGLLERQQVYPSLQFAAMCNAAQLIEAHARYTPDRRDAGLKLALEKLAAAVALIEQQRTNTFGDDVARAEFFTQYRAAFDLLVQFHLDAYGRLGDEEHLVQALVAAEQSRSRALLDQLRMAYVEDPRELPTDDSQPTPQSLAGLIRQCRDSKQPLLYYYVGAARSYLFLLGGSQPAIQPIRLQAGSDAADFSTTATDASARWIDLHVSRLYASMSDPQSAASQATDRPTHQRLVASSLVLLPRAAREYLEQQQALGASHVVVVPHGAISQIPLEALVIDEPGHQYLDDVAPPLAYAPSLTLLDHLSRSVVQGSAAPAVLTLGNPNYAAQANPNVEDKNRSAAALPPLPDSQKECDRIEAAFGKASVTKLDGDRASEKLLREALGSHRFSLVHLAAHGVLQNDDLNPWLALASTRDAPPSADSDGRLDLRDIYRLNLAGCELTALSACNTNLDARQTARLRTLPVGDGDKTAGLAPPALDSGFSIANAFLAAGSRRVLATEWTVSDDSTAELIGRFFELLQGELAAGRPVNYARLLKEARQQLRRGNSKWDTPFHWAPFVLIGPADSRATP